MGRKHAKGKIFKNKGLKIWLYVCVCVCTCPEAEEFFHRKINFWKMEKNSQAWPGGNTNTHSNGPDKQKD